MSEIIPADAPPHGLLITGIVPDATKRYVVAITRDEDEFRRAFPEYKRHVAEGRRQEAGGILYISTRISVSEKGEGFAGGKKTRDMPEKVGSFFYELLSSRSTDDRGAAGPGGRQARVHDAYHQGEGD